MGVGWARRAGLTISTLLIVLTAIYAYFALPTLVFPPIPGEKLAGLTPGDKLAAQARNGELQNGVRASYAQVVGATLVLVGAAAAWRQLQHNVRDSREQHQHELDALIVERFNRAVEHTGTARAHMSGWEVSIHLGE